MNDQGRLDRQAAIMIREGNLQALQAAALIWQAAGNLDRIEGLKTRYAMRQIRSDLEMLSLKARDLANRMYEVER